jgi:diaminopimelate epimerase
VIKTIPFAKYHGLGNDWLVALERHVPADVATFAQRILERHTGVGADGLIVLAKPKAKAHDAQVRFFNADGSEAEMSGNGIRCAAAFLLDQKGEKRFLQIEAAAGVKSLEKKKGADGTWSFRVQMGAPVLDAARIPFRPNDVAAPVLGYPLRTEQGALAVTVTSMGNPHCSVFVADFDAVDWPKLGREIELNDHFPNRTNVEFIRLVSNHEIEVRFWERGVGHTMSSGTGSCAAAVAAILNGLTERQVQVSTEAGTLQVAWPEEGEVWLTGPAQRVMEGKFYYRGPR